MELNYLMLVHKNPEQVHRLIRKLNTENVNFFVHVDKAVNIQPFIEPWINAKNVFFLKEEERMVTAWSDIGGCEILIKLLKTSIEKVKTPSYCIFLSGQDYPIKHNAAIFAYLQNNYGKNFIELKKVADIWPDSRIRLERYNFHFPKKRNFRGLYPLRDKRFFSLPNLKNILYMGKHLGPVETLQTIFKKKRRHPSSLEPIGGSAFWAFPRETVIELLAFLDKHPEFLAYHSHSHVPDEIMFHSIINKIKKPEEIGESITYTNWLREREDLASPVTFYTEDDLKELLSLGDHYLLARKFDVDLGSSILDELDDKTSPPSLQ